MKYNYMTLQKTRKFEIAMFIAVLIILFVIWMKNGYDETWYFVVAAIIAIPISWYSFGKKQQ